MADLIAITGHKRAGKDALGGYLVREHGYTLVKFAEPLYRAALALDPYVPTDYQERDRLSSVVRRVGWEVAKDRYPEVRRILQRLGTDSIRALDPDFWVRMAVESVCAALVVPGARVVLTDCRFPNEATAIRSMGGLIVRIIRPGFCGDAHPSETAMDDYYPDVTVHNIGTADDLKYEAHALAFQRTPPLTIPHYQG